MAGCGGGLFGSFGVVIFRKPLYSGRVFRGTFVHIFHKYSNNFRSKFKIQKAIQNEWILKAGLNNFQIVSTTKCVLPQGTPALAGFATFFLQEQLADARLWRSLLAHDAKHLDLSGQSWAARVCRDSLGFWGHKLREINSYLGLQKDSLEAASGFRPGSVLCVLCIFIWSLFVMKELRMYWLTVQGIYWTPRSIESTAGETLKISCVRLWALISLYFLRASIVITGLFGGVLWLGKTTSWVEMIFMTSALPMVLNLDKHVFAAIMPMEIKLGIQRFRPFKVTYSRIHSQVETFLAAFLVVTLLLVSYSQVINPMEQALLDMKLELCGGKLDFVAAFNPDTQMTLAMETALDRPAARAVGDYIFSSASPASPASQPSCMAFTQPRSFGAEESQSMREEANLAACWEDLMNSSEVNSSQEEFLLHRGAAALVLGLPKRLSCEEMAGRCQDPEARLLRLACGITCGCAASESSSPWYKVEAQGCSPKCLQKATVNPVTCSNPILNQTWYDLWDEYIPALSGFLQKDLTLDETHSQLLQTVEGMKSQGCAFLLTEPKERLTGKEWCAGHPDLFRPFTQVCPESCGLCI